MKTELIERISSLVASGVPVKTRHEVEQNFPARELKPGAEVTRFCPSPTGFVHIGILYTAMICQFLARQTGGVYILRIEDTDKKREVAGAKALIVSQLEKFGLTADEGLQSDGRQAGNYGPYLQSERQAIYLAYALELLKNGRAYPCFATPDELTAAVQDQQAKKMRPGYYGQWALWRDRSDQDIADALDAGLPFVLRFRSEGNHERRVQLTDALKGTLELPENDLDVPLIKSDDSRLPTYHLAHVVDDFLMKSTIILRGEEWLPSTPLHLELCQALGIPAFRYAHMGLISIVDQNGGGKRKLSKRKDPEADIAYWLAAGYPLRAVKAYLLGLANSNFEDWYKANPSEPLENFELSLIKLAASRSPLLDIKKVEDYARDEIARLSPEEYEDAIINHASPKFRRALEADIAYTQAVLAIERDGDQPRKDLAKFSDAYEQYGYFFDELFESDFKQRINQELSDFETETKQIACSRFLETYNPEDSQEQWFEKLKTAAEKSGFAVDNQAYKQNPETFKGKLADYAKIIRVSLTGKNRTPDLYLIMQVMGLKRVRNRLD